jgi:nicotinate-nucleotide pyrophosphorylase (carboxylating)
VTALGSSRRPLDLQEIVAAALAEDVGDGDRTTLWTVPPGRHVLARVVAKEPVVVAGGDAFAEAVFQVAPAVKLRGPRADGLELNEGEVVVEMEGSARGVLTAERTALNFLAHLSGIATLTRRFVEAVEGTQARITDTRKTTPGLRELEKAAVRAGGGVNHRMGLYDMVLIKENHIAVAGGIRNAVEMVRRENGEDLPVEVEVARIGQLEPLEGMGLDRILLDNMSVDELSRAVDIVRGWDEPHPLLEASGNMTLDRARRVAETGVDLISVGALTHSAPVADLSLLLEGVEP